MQTKIEGLLIYKAEYQDRHLIGHLLLRNGEKVSVLFYGGQGGGKKKKSTILELGNMLSIELQKSKTNIELYRAREWKVIWSPKSIRFNHKAFTTMCFFLEVVGKVAQDGDLYDENKHGTEEGIFRVLSNALFYLDKSVEDNEFNSEREFLLFLGKLLHEQGVFPQWSHCNFCEGPLQTGREVSALLADHGGFVCVDCSHHEARIIGGPNQAGQGSVVELWRCLGMIKNSKYSDLRDMSPGLKGTSRMLLDYFLYQFQLGPSEFKSLPMVLQV